MEEKQFSAKKRYQIYNALAWLGVIVAMIGFFLDGTVKTALTWVGFGFVVIAIIFRFTMVKCPYCGNHLTESKTLPDKCPECHKELK